MKRAMMNHAIALADEIAQSMHRYPMLLPTTPPRIVDIDEVFSATRGMISYHLLATHPDKRFA